MKCTDDLHPSSSVGFSVGDRTVNSLAVCREKYGSAVMGRSFRVPQPASVVSGSMGLAGLSGIALGKRIEVFLLLHSSSSPQRFH